MTIRVGVFGAAGRMGRTVCEAVVADPDLELVAAVDPMHGGLDLKPVTGVDFHLEVDSTADRMADAGVQVAIDFSVAVGARENIRWCAEHGVHAVVGTSGLTDADHAEARRLFTSSNCLIAPNFAVGAVLMVKLSELAASYFDTVHVVEMHHDGKIDSPSGTAVHTAERIAAASPIWAADPTEKETIPHAGGARGAGSIPIHSLRVRGMIASQEVLFGTTGQSLSIRHDTFDRTSFMPGVILAVKRIADHPGLSVGLDQYLGI